MRLRVKARNDTKFILPKAIKTMINKTYFKQAWRLLKENRLLSMVSILGTALAICLVMVIVIVWQVRTAGFKPETHRERMLFVRDGRASRKTPLFVGGEAGVLPLADSGGGGLGDRCLE